ncbi:PREDICTED: zonadhesin-like isoform X3 [Papilio xuthus]|uniref:Zonadhesin-like isoform X3 n=1 Tax=Papilio xuthus TaxID=66420 RepID=A0AAJ6ZJZ9_PAPXU|nr:PREDICTED: zonadhesin-like isoform X3 [Papilio xuthus]
MLILYMLLIPVANVYTICTGKPEPTCGQNSTYIDCPSACPSTCKSPNERNCNKKCAPKGCHCNPSYILSKPKGQCILPTECPGGNPCPRNETFVACSIGCPTNYCPVDDSLAILICDPAWPCPSGCSCKPNYKRKSVKEPRCILAAECPPVKCTRPNEEWNPCTNSCLRENCYDLKENHIVCKPQGCEPRCTCKKGYYRNDSGICVPASQCSPPPIKCGVNEEYSTCKIKCPPQFCNISYTDYGICPNDTKCEPGCNCIKDHLRDFEGKCVLNDNCPPPPTPCGGNATHTDCASSCPPTCQTPKPEGCIGLCKPDVKCQCMPSYVLSPNGDCILPEDCPASPPVCGENEVSTVCKKSCPSDSCDSEKQQALCRPGPCRPGCNCKEGYARDANGKCIPKDQCPAKPIKCGSNATLVECTSACPRTCEEKKQEICIALCKPKGCECKPSYVLSPKGDCILPQDCPAPNPCGGNATATDCASSCPPTCQTPKPGICAAVCKPNVKCKCKPSYVLAPNGDCILPQDCPAPPPVCGENEVSTNCKTSCPSDSCDSKEQQSLCKPGPCRPGCNCKEGYARDSNGKCIPKDQCPKTPSTCGGNATYTDCASSCPLTCENPKPEVCIDGCKPNVTCQCKPSYVLSPNGDCILPEDCPATPPPVCGENEVSTVCKTRCPSDLCDSGKQQGICRPGPCRRGCNCKEGYARDSNGKCIPKDQCPKTPSPCGSNATYTDCASSCPPTCQTPKPKLCPAVCKPNVKCKCKPSYVLSPNGDCVLPQDCPAPPPVCGENEVSTNCKTTCPSDSCDSKEQQSLCRPGPCRPGCNCKEGYARDSNGKCIPKDQCPKTPSPCGGNATYTDCASSCPLTCENLKPEVCIFLCKPNVTCQCKPSYVLSPNGDCILPEDCPAIPPPECGKNEVSTVCKTRCPSDLCDSGKQQGICRPGPCRPGCNCKEGYARDSNGKCIPKDQCPKIPTPCGGNATYTDCASSCPLTCENPKPEVCIFGCKPNVTCQCKPSYVLSPNGDCILPQDCPAPKCGGNATIVACASSCPSTCQTLNPQSCTAQCNPNSCQCNSSYILSKPKGECILPVDCPGGSPCSQNETFVACNIRCPNSYCPVDDRQGILICDPPRPCPSGCSCKLNYKRKSMKDPRCILAEECPPVKCTRPNEEWNTCPTSCLKENCEDLKITNTACKPSRTNCQPRCACKEGFYRNASRICVPASECFPSNTCDIPDECKATCAEPNPKNCPYQSATKNVEGCKCKPGFVLSDKNGECIRIEECPAESGCNGDNNAFITKCPPPCPSTCESPNEVPCKKSCLPVGCKCKDGFILSKLNGICIKPDNCTGGNPCKNGAFTSCNNKCPYNYCPIDDSPPDYNCTAPNPCRSGCICRFNHRKKSVSDEQCILASDCPPVNCTRPNEVWDSCPSACLNEGCENAGKKPPVCNTLILNCQPRCVCKPKTYRDKNNVCVPVDQCPAPPVVCGENEVETCNFDDDYSTEVSVCKPTCNCKENYSRDSNGKCVPDRPVCSLKTCDVPTECRRTCAEPNPKNCSYEEVSENQNGCKCKPGYILLDKSGKCVKIQNCPSDLSCNGDANAVVSQCPSPCPSTCSAPNEILCKKSCLDVGCKCKEGFILSKLNGICIPPEKCKGGNPCGKNATFSSCSNRCSYNYCPKDDSPPNYNCALPYRCPSGCVCNLNYRRKSIDDRQCILASECPPVNCTRPNEVFDSCPSDCLQERCEDAGKDPVPCNTFVLNCQPKCVCKANTFRNKDNICVPVSKCPEK